MSKKKGRDYFRIPARKYGFFDRVLEDTIGAYLYRKKKRVIVKWRNW